MRPIRYEHPQLDGLWVAYIGSGVLTLSIIPFTLLAMAPTNNRLLRAAAGDPDTSSSNTATGTFPILSFLLLYHHRFLPSSRNLITLNVIAHRRQILRPRRNRRRHVPLRRRPSPTSRQVGEVELRQGRAVICRVCDRRVDYGSGRR